LRPSFEFLPELRNAEPADTVVNRSSIILTGMFDAAAKAVARATASSVEAEDFPDIDTGSPK
jgi:hypothetical protein